MVNKTPSLINTIKKGTAHRVCSVETLLVQPNEKDTQRPNLDKKCVAEFFKKLYVETMTGRPIYMAYPSGQGSKLTLYRG